MSNSTKTLSEMVRERGGDTSDDDVRARIAEEFFPEFAPSPPAAVSAPPPVADASPEPEPVVDRDAFLRYDALRRTNPERFAEVLEKMRTYAEFNPTVGKKWDSDHGAFCEGYTQFDRQMRKAEFRAKYGRELKFVDEVEAAEAAEAARNSAAAQEEARRQEAVDAEARRVEALRRAQREGDWKTEESILMELAKKHLEDLT